MNSSAQVADKVLLKCIDEEQHDTTRVFGYVELAKNYRLEAPEKAIYYMDKAEMLIEQNLSKGTKYKGFYLNQLTKVYNVSGVIYRNFGNYPEAIRSYKKALRLLETVDNKKVQSSTLFNIGLLNEFLKKPNESLKYFRQSLEIRERMGDSTGLVNCYRSIGRTMYVLGDYSAALENLEKSLEIAQASGEIKKIYKVYSYMADVFEKMGSNDVAIDSLYSALTIYDSSEKKFPKEHYRISVPLAQRLYTNGDWNEGIEVLKRSIQITEKTDSQTKLSLLYFNIAKGYEKKGDYKNAYRYLSLKVTSDSIDKVNSNSDEIVRVEMNYLFKKQHVADSLKLVRESEVSLLRLKKKNIEVENSQTRSTFLVIVIVLLLGLGFFIYRNYRLKRKALSSKEKDVESLALKIKRESDWIDNLVALNDKIKKNKVSNTSEEIQNLVNAMRDNLVVDKHRQVQAKNIEVVTNEFRDKLKASFPELTKTEIEMCELIRLELSNSEISRIRNISQNSARMARYRLKKKLKLEEGETIFDVLKGI